MRFRIAKGKVRVFEPFAVFCILAGLGINVAVPLVTASIHTDPHVRATAVRIIWLLSALSSLAYSIFVLKYLLVGSVLDRVVYGVMAALFLGLTVVTVFLP